MNKKNIFTSFALFFLLCAGVFVVYNTQRRDSGNIDDPASYAFTQFKSTCTTFDAPAGAERIYRNTAFGFQFTYPDNAVVCERTFPQDAGKAINEILIFKKIHFDSATGGSGPDMVLHINDTDIDGLPNPIVLESREDVVAGKQATVRKVRSPACTDNECPVITTYQFEHRDNVFIIEDRTESTLVVNSFIFAD